MFSLMQLTQNGDALVISYRAIVGTSLIVFAVALVAMIAVRRARMKRRWPVFAAAAIALWSGVYFATFRATITQDSASVYAFTRYEHTMRWKDAAGAYLDRSGGEPHVVLIDRERRALQMNVTDLPASERQRVLDYMRARIAATDGARVPTQLERRAPSRAVNPFSDQQI